MLESGEWRVKSGDALSAKRTIKMAPRAPDDAGLHVLTRVLVGLGVPALLLGVCAGLLRGGHLLCPVYELTGLYCPGCGSGRAALALLLSPPCAWVLGREYLRFVFPRLGLGPTRLPARAGELSLALIAVFTLLRNLPAFAFLAP